jgi:dihydrofolate synthase / folylpolyglutamate synthase
MPSQYQKDITFLESLSNIPKTTYMLGPKDKKIFIERIKKFLSLVGNPQTNLKFIHIAGTSGKGSTVKILESLIADAQLKTGSFTSPFATTSIERISINNKLISPAELHDILELQIKPALDKYVLKYSDFISYFEVWLVIALLHFKKQACDWVILEAGLGGLHDTTNVISKPKITAITNIGLDHTHILGNTKTKIAKDKAGIIKKNSIFLTTEKNKKLLTLFKNTCKKKQAWFINLENLSKNYKTSNYFGTSKQQDNLNLALNILGVLKIRPKNIQQIINTFKLTCRQEIISKKPLVILDGAHNKDKLDNLIAFVSQQKYKKLHLVLAFAENKDYKTPLKKLLTITNNLYLTRFIVNVRKSAELKKLYQDSHRIAGSRSRDKNIKAKMPISVHNDPYQALALALKNYKTDDLILVTGSFFLAGELRKKWISEEYILKNLKLDRK